jgi:Family of unknown function (DUF5990)
MRIVIVAANFPGRRCCQPDGRVFDNVHVGIQLKAEPKELFPGDADSACWNIDVRIKYDADDNIDFSGDAVHGKRGDRFLYLTWGNVHVGGAFEMFRRGKLNAAPN